MKIALDFGTCNTVIARWREADNDVEIMRENELHKSFAYKTGENDRKNAYVIPSLIHFGEGDHTLLGAQVEEKGLTDHAATFRWIKLDMLRNNRRTRRINGKLISFHEAAGRLLGDLLLFTTGGIAENSDELVITVPVESYDHYVEWIRETAAQSFPGGIRILDEATACILGYHDTVQNGNKYMVFDFGGGTLDVCIVKADFESDGSQKCKVLGRSGEEVGGMMVDRWMLEHLVKVENLSKQDVADIGVSLLSEIEEAKISLSAGADKADINQFNDMTGSMISHRFTKDELEGLLRKKRNDKDFCFYDLIVRTVDRALEAALNNYGTRKSEIDGVFMVGGTSLLYKVPEIIKTLFAGKNVRCDNPFEAIARGACRYAGQDFDATLVHDYCLKSWNRSTKQYDLEPIVPKGTKYPTEPDKVVCAKYISAACSHAYTLGLVIYERSEMVRPDSRMRIGANGQVEIIGEGVYQVTNVREINPEDNQFLHAVPSCNDEHKRRFIAGFAIDEHKRLTLSLKDTLEGNQSYVLTSSGKKIPLPLKNYPMVRL